MNGVYVIAEHCGGSHDRPRCSAKNGADADPNLLTSPASENKISHLHKFGSDRILDILLILCSVVIGTRETIFFPERPADVAMPVQAVRVGHSLSFRRSRGSPGYSTWGACRGSNSRAGHCTCGTFLKATPKSGSVRGAHSSPHAKSAAQTSSASFTNECDALSLRTAHTFEFEER